MWSQKLLYQDGEFTLTIPYSFPEFVTPAGKKMAKKEKIQLNVNAGPGTEILCKTISHPLKVQVYTGYFLFHLWVLSRPIKFVFWILVAGTKTPWGTVGFSIRCRCPHMVKLWFCHYVWCKFVSVLVPIKEIKLLACGVWFEASNITWARECSSFHSPTCAVSYCVTSPFN